MPRPMKKTSGKSMMQERTGDANPTSTRIPPDHSRNWQEAIPMMAKACIRPSDNSMGRAIKLTTGWSCTRNTLVVQNLKTGGSSSGTKLTSRWLTVKRSSRSSMQNAAGRLTGEEEDHFRSEDQIRCLGTAHQPQETLQGGLKMVDTLPRTQSSLPATE